MDAEQVTQLAEAMGAGEAGMDIEAAKAALTGGDATLDALADLILLRLGQFIGECAQEPNFCAVAIDANRDINGRLLSLTLTPCDEVGGEPVRRQARH